MVGLIFDMDGVVVDNFKFHEAAWKLFCQNHNVPFDASKFMNEIFGTTNQIHLNTFFEKRIEKEMVKEYAEEKEKIYREIYQPEICPVSGLKSFLDQAVENQIPIALATSSPPINVQFVLKNTNLEKYFNVVVDATQVKNGKPDPEIFLKAAKKISTNPKNCWVFEDSKPGIEAAKKAGMKVCALATTHHFNDLQHADIVIKDFFDRELLKLKNLANFATQK